MSSILDHSNLFAPHIIQEEGGIVNHFYCSINNDVTVGVGHFMETSKQAADLFKQGIKFYKNDTLVTDINEVTQEWSRIKEIGKGKNWYAKKYKAYATLRIDDSDAHRIFKDDFTNKAKLLISRRPWVVALPVEIQYALVDTLYNPAGIALFGTKPKVKRMWNNLEKYVVTKNPATLMLAKELFEMIWINAAPRQANYKDRVKRRLKFFRIGIILNTQEFNKTPSIIIS